MVASRGTWDLSSLTRERTPLPCLLQWKQSLNSWAAGEDPGESREHGLGSSADLPPAFLRSLRDTEQVPRLSVDTSDPTGQWVGRGD